ncbi:MAG TPA: hypothetical protein VIK73_01135 [Limnochordales bacterium]
MELVGTAEAADILGWDRRKVSVYAARGRLPKPVAVLRCGPVWRRQDIEAAAAVLRGDAAAVAAALAEPEPAAVLEASKASGQEALPGASGSRSAPDDRSGAGELSGRARDLLEVGARLWAATMDAGQIAMNRPAQADFAAARRAFAEEAFERALLHEIERLLGWEEAAWPDYAAEALETALTLLNDNPLGTRYRVAGGRLQRQKRGQKRWTAVR